MAQAAGASEVKWSSTAIDAPSVVLLVPDWSLLR
jgi:hypothetical protein